MRPGYRGRMRVLPAIGCAAVLAALPAIGCDDDPSASGSGSGAGGDGVGGSGGTGASATSVGGAGGAGGTAMPNPACDCVWCGEIDDRKNGFVDHLGRLHRMGQGLGELPERVDCETGVLQPVSTSDFVTWPRHFLEDGRSYATLTGDGALALYDADQSLIRNVGGDPVSPPHNDAAALSPTGEAWVWANETSSDPSCPDAQRRGDVHAFDASGAELGPIGLDGVLCEPPIYVLGIDNGFVYVNGGGDGIEGGTVIDGVHTPWPARILEGEFVVPASRGQDLSYISAPFWPVSPDFIALISGSRGALSVARVDALTGGVVWRVDGVASEESANPTEDVETRGTVRQDFRSGTVLIHWEQSTGVLPPDRNILVQLDANSGAELWRREMDDFHPMPGQPGSAPPAVYPDLCGRVFLMQRDTNGSTTNKIDPMTDAPVTPDVDTDPDDGVDVCP